MTNRKKKYDYFEALEYKGVPVINLESIPEGEIWGVDRNGKIVGKISLNDKPKPKVFHLHISRFFQGIMTGAILIMLFWIGSTIS